MKTFFVIIVIFLYSAKVNCAELISDSPELHSFKGKKPILRILDLNGQEFDLQRKRGKVVIINFWAKWCNICRSEMNVLNKIFQINRNNSVEIIGISLDPEVDRAEVKQISENLFYQNATIGDLIESNIEEPNSVPVSYFINKKGFVVAVIKGRYGSADLQKIIEAILI